MQYGLLAIIAFLLVPDASMMRGQQQASLGAPQAQASPGGESQETLHLLVGRSLVVSSPARIKRVSVADPAIIDAVVVNPNQILLLGKAPGGVSLVLWDDTGQNQAFDVYVDLDTRGLANQLHEIFPSEALKVTSEKDTAILSGMVSSQAVADKMLEMAKSSAPKAVSLLQIPAVAGGEVLLQVRFAEVDRTALTQLGFNIMGLPGGKFVGSVSTQQFGEPQLQGGTLSPIPSTGPTQSVTTTTTSTASTTASSTQDSFTMSDILNIFLYRPDINMAATIKALQQENLLQILAEPNVLTENGKEASFLAGGEFPFPTIQPGGAGSVPVVTVTFREFGVRLTFTPVLTPDGYIHLKVRPEVSSLDYSNSLSIAGYVIPALSTRRVESEMMLKDGQSFAIAGLMDNRVTELLAKVPGLGDIPILGKLFQSRSLNKSKTELLVLVTPRIVKPLAPSEVPAGPYFPKSFLPPLPGEKKTPAAKK
jgi:pilus assembly protein CpaC